MKRFLRSALVLLPTVTYAIFSRDSPLQLRMAMFVLAITALSIVHHVRFAPLTYKNQRARYWDLLEKCAWYFAATTPWFITVYLTEPVLLQLVLAALLLVFSVYIVPVYVRWRASPLGADRISFRRGWRTVVIGATEFDTLEYGRLGAHAVLNDGRRIPLADDESAAVLIGMRTKSDWTPLSPAPAHTHPAGQPSDAGRVPAWGTSRVAVVHWRS